jgi:hypothetical protein
MASISPGDWPSSGHALAMLPEIYNHALLADKKFATHVNDLLEAGTINDRQAYMAWLLIAFCGKRYAPRRRR